MLPGGLWHGASWNFLIWDGYQGGLPAIERAPRGDRPLTGEWDWNSPIRAVLTYLLACIGWVFFRAADLRQSLQVLGQMFADSGGGDFRRPGRGNSVHLFPVLATDCGRRLHH
jgi:alginate O-acetyltransferase complex protein AlgI